MKLSSDILSPTIPLSFSPRSTSITKSSDASERGEKNRRGHSRETGRNTGGQSFMTVDSERALARRAVRAFKECGRTSFESH